MIDGSEGWFYERTLKKILRSLSMFKKIAMLFFVLSFSFSFNSLVAKENGQDSTCQGHPTCEEGDFGPSN